MVGCLEGIFYANGLFLATGHNAKLLTSPNGTNWTTQTVGGGSSYHLYTSAYGNGLFAAAGFPGTYIRTSTNAVNWTNQPTGFAASISGLDFANGTFVAAADNGAVLTSFDGATWLQRERKAAKNLWATAYGNHTFVVVGDNGTILQSDSTIPPVLAAAYRAESNSIQLSVSGEVGRSYRIQSLDAVGSTNWQDLTVFTNTSPSMQILDPVNSTQRFYRAASP
jgi:hypothetical protein